jgi:hypothetical protein
MENECLQGPGTSMHICCPSLFWYIAQTIACAAGQTVAILLLIEASSLPLSWYSAALSLLAADQQYCG